MQTDGDHRERAAVLLYEGRLVELENRSETPSRDFVCSPTAWAQVADRAELVIHTHPNGQTWPSLHDMQQQRATGVPWAIIPAGSDPFAWGPGARLPLRWRPYRWGVTDCYALVRDALAELFNFTVQDFPREWGYERSGVPIFEPKLEAAGCQVVGDRIDAAQPGDTLLWRLHCKVTNHCGLLVEPGRMLHHPSPREPFAPGHWPALVPLERWQAFPVQVVRPDA